VTATTAITEFKEPETLETAVINHKWKWQVAISLVGMLATAAKIIQR